MWLKKDDRFAQHRKVRRLSDAAYRLHDTAMLSCAHDETDGMLEPIDVEDMPHGHRLSKRIDELVAAGLWHKRGHRCPKCAQPTANGWVIHDFLDYNDSHELQEQRREKDRERQRNRRQRRAGIGTDDRDVSRRDTTRDTTRDTERDSQGVSRDPGPGRAVPGRSGPFRLVGGDQESSVTDVTREPTDALTLGGEH